MKRMEVESPLKCILKSQKNILGLFLKNKYQRLIQS